MSVITELNRLIDDETLIYKDVKTQFADYIIKKVVVSSTNEEFLSGLLYDLFDGHVFGPDTAVEVVLLVEEDQLACVESVYCNFMTGGLPKFKDLKVSSCLEDMSGSDFLILHHEIDWGPPEKIKTRKEIINEHFSSIRTWGMNMNRYLSSESQVLLIGDCLSTVRFILGLYSPDVSHSNIHGVTRHYERAAASILASQIQVPMYEIKGIGVFGEDIVESTNSWVHFSHDDKEEDIYEESIRYYQPEAYEMIKINCKKDDIRLQDSKEKSITEQHTKSSGVFENSVGDSLRNNKSPGKLNTDTPALGRCWSEVASERGWECSLADARLHELPKEWSREDSMTELLRKKPPVRELKWVVARQDDEKYHSYTLPKKCKSVQSGYSLARGVSDYISLLEQKTLQRTNALVCSPDVYNVPSGMFFSFPVIIDVDGKFKIVQGYRVSHTTFMRINQFVKTLIKDYDYIFQLFQDFPPDQEESTIITESNVYSSVRGPWLEEQTVHNSFIEDGVEEIEVEEK